MDFSAWLSRRLKQTIRLPTEWEWLWAAKSARRDYQYPWARDWEGNKNHLDTRENAYRRILAVGCFPRGRSDQGVYDLCSYVEEWCLNDYNIENVQLEGNKFRALRGGHWDGGQCLDHPRPEARNYGNITDSSVGGYSFRLVRVPSLAR